MSATAFKAAVKNWKGKTQSRVRDTFVFTTEEIERSIKFGSPLTGAAGQPVDEGDLRNSYIGDFLTRALWQITTDKEYAEFIEAGGNDLGPFTLRSEVGGFHSIAVTRINFDRIVAFAARKASGRNV